MGITYTNHELAQDHQDVVGVDGGPLRNNVGVDQALTVKEGQQHLLCLAGMDFGLDGAWLALLDPLLRLPFHLGSVVGHHRLVHSDDLVQHRH